MDDMCTACLCIGRNLYFIGETGHYHLYSQILNEIPVYDFSDVCVRVCWECRAMLRRFGEFKTLVKRSYTKLLRQLHHSDPPKKCSLICSPHLQIQNVIDISYPDIQVKEEDTLEDHNFISERADKYHNLEEPLSVDEVKVEDSDIYGNNKSDIYVNNKEARETRKSKKTLKEKIKKVKKKKKVLPRTVKKHNKGEQNIQENSSESVIDERTSDGVTTTVNDDVFMMVMCSEDNLEDKDEKFNVINSDADDIECTVQEKEIPIVKMPPLTPAEKQRRYKEKLKKVPEKYEEYKRKKRENYHAKKRLVEELTPKEKFNARAIWKLRKRNLREKKRKI
ncbi:hypothetical protein evm_012688 [Chilo suppressalis]|nr:hypothetical protein evm_012688 [Chilo suppressalis]